MTKEKKSEKKLEKTNRKKPENENAFLEEVLKLENISKKTSLRNSARKKARKTKNEKILENAFQDLKTKLKSYGYKLTPQRRAVLNVILENSEEHLSSEEVYNIVKEKSPDIGLATVYRTLQLFSDLKLLSKLNLDDNLSRYELKYNEEGHDHHHLICENCNSIDEVHVDFLEKLETYIEDEYKFEIKNHKLKFFGYCKKCLQK